MRRKALVRLEVTVNVGIDIDDLKKEFGYTNATLIKEAALGMPLDDLVPFMTRAHIIDRYTEDDGTGAPKNLGKGSY